MIMMMMMHDYFFCLVVKNVLMDGMSEEKSVEYPRIFYDVPSKEIDVEGIILLLHCYCYLKVCTTCLLYVLRTLDSFHSTG